MTETEWRAAIAEVVEILERQGKTMTLEPGHRSFRFVRSPDPEDGHADVRFHEHSREESGMVVLKAGSDTGEDSWINPELETAEGLAEQVWELSDPDRTAFTY
jgi:hypothetical protein